MQWTMNAKNTISNMPIDSFMTSSMFSKYSKMNVSHNIPVSASYKVLKYFNLGLGVNYTEDWFFKTIKKHWDDDQGKVITDTIPGFKALRQFSTSASLTTMVFGMFNISEKGKLRAIRHVMSPSLTYHVFPGLFHFVLELLRRGTDRRPSGADYVLLVFRRHGRRLSQLRRDEPVVVVFAGE